MGKGLIALILFLFLLILILKPSFAGNNDVWLVCDSGNSSCSAPGHSKTIGSDVYYCCLIGNTYAWQKGSDCCGGGITTTTTPPPIPPTTTTTRPTTTTTVPPTTTTTIPSTCNNNGRCESGEIQGYCSDCKTVVRIYPSTSYPGQTVKVTVYFNDSRFDTTKDAKVYLTIDNQYWDPSYCPINNKKWKEEMGYGMTSGGWSCHDKRCSKVYGEKNVAIVTEMGYGYIEAECVIPLDLQRGTHKLKATPTIYSEPITLRAAEVEIKIGDGLYTFVLIVKRIFSRITGLFVF